MKTTDCRFSFKSKNLAGDLAKFYVSVITEKQTRTQVVIVIKRILTSDRSVQKHKILRYFKDKVLVEQEILVKKDTLFLIANQINKIQTL